MPFVFHKHRLIPGHVGGTYDPRNVVRVNVAMHAFLHQQLWLTHGHRADLKGWQMLTSMIGRDAIASMRVGWRTWLADPENRKRFSEDSRARLMGHIVTAETRAKLRAYHLGRKHTAEARAKVSASLAGNQRNRGKGKYQVARAS